MIKISIEEVKQRIKNIHGDAVVLDEATYKGTQTKARFIDKDHGEWWTHPYSIFAGFGNPKRNIKLTIERIKNIISQKEGTLLNFEKEVKKNSKLEILCKENHRFTTTCECIVYKNTWCIFCFHNSQKIKLEEIQQIANERGGFLISKSYINSKEKLNWICENGHNFKMSFIRVSMGFWCSVCSKRAKKTIEEIKQFAKNKGGECLSEEYKNSKQDLTWKCYDGHVWKAKWNNIQSGTWCKFCSSGKSQKTLYAILQSIFFDKKYKFFYNYKKFDWLKTNSKWPQEIDIFVKDLNSNFSLAVEYDGEQHYKPMRFRNSEKMYMITQARDLLKNKAIFEHPEDVKYFIRIPYWENLTEKNIRKILANYSVI